MQPSTEIRYLSLEWIDALTEAVAGDPELAELAAQHSVGLTQVVEDGPEGTVTYHLQLDGDGARFAAGPAEPEHLRLMESWQTAVAVATGELNAEQAFLAGSIRLLGDPSLILGLQPVLAALHRVFERVAARTVYA
jgi:putative sterol carrier protein